MAATEPYKDSPITIAERYEGAANTSNLTVYGGMIPDGSGSSAGEVVLAAGLAQRGDYGAVRLGMALLRLHSEFTAAAKPHRPTRVMIESYAATLRERDAKERASRVKANGELARLQALHEKYGVDWDGMVEMAAQARLYHEGKLPLPEVKSGNVMQRAQNEVSRWYINELRLLATRLRSRGAVSRELTEWALLKGIDAETVAQAILYFLDSTCPKCHGHGLIFGEHQAVKQCHDCNGTGSSHRTQEVGRVLAHIAYAMGLARSRVAGTLKAMRK